MVVWDSEANEQLGEESGVEDDLAGKMRCAGGYCYGCSKHDREMG